MKAKENEEWTGMVARHVASLCQAREENATIRAADAEKGEKLKEQGKTIRDQAYKLEISGIVRLGICASLWNNMLTHCPCRRTSSMQRDWRFRLVGTIYLKSCTRRTRNSLLRLRSPTRYAPFLYVTRLD